MRIAAGIDGGGTGTVLELRSERGEVLLRSRFGPFNLNSIGEERFRALLKDLYGSITGAGTCGAVCFGASGVSNPAVAVLIEEEARKAGYSGRILLKGDDETALWGAHSGGAGGILIAGTGSICAGKGADGTVVRIGGWGHLIDDGGSGYAVGRDALLAVARARDGRGKPTALTEYVKKEWNVQDRAGLVSAVYGGDKSRIAALSPLVEQAARDGDRAASAILEKNAEDLLELVETMAETLCLTETPFSLMGGLITHDTWIRQLLTDKIRERLPGVCLKAPDLDAVGGAALLALDAL